jgi:hypothetical protein
MALARQVSIRSANTPPDVRDLAPAEETDYSAGLAAAPAIEAAAQTQRANGDTLRQRTRQALAANAAFLALPLAQQQVQAVAQTVRLTQQVTGLIRLAIGALDSTAGA